MSALKIKKEQVAFLITLAFAVAFVVIGALKGTDLTHGVDVGTSSTVTTTVTATVKDVIAISASATVALGDLTPGTPVHNTGDVTVTSNSVKGWKLYNYADNYMTRTTAGCEQSIADLPSGTPAAPEQWNVAADFGLGFSLSGPINDSVWHSGAGAFCYSSFTTTSAGAQLVNNYVTWSNKAENLTVLYVLDVGTAQLGGAYKAEISWFAVTNV